MGPVESGKPRMPTYRFENIETGEIFEKWMLMAEKDSRLV
jgi:predicted nucleic acid-binding Zn ribbon protein